MESNALMGETRTNPLQDPIDSDAHLEARIDESIDESFPASDPPAVSLRDEPPSSPRIEAPEQSPRRSRSTRTLLLTVVPAVLTLGGIALARYLRQKRSSR